MSKHFFIRAGAAATGLLLLSAAALPAQSQRLDVVLGGTLSHLSDGHTGRDGRWGGGFAVGVALGVPVGRGLYLRPELLILRREARRAGSDVVCLADLPPDPIVYPCLPLGDAQARLTSLQMPVLLRAEFGGGRRVRPYLVAGPALSVRVGCSQRDPDVTGNAFYGCDGTLYYPTYPAGTFVRAGDAPGPAGLTCVPPGCYYPVPTGTSLQEADVHLVLGGGIDAGPLGVELRIDQGLRSVSDRSAAYAGAFDGAKLTTFSLLVSLRTAVWRR